jgi:RND superfamily putative drug exporter
MKLLGARNWYLPRWLEWMPEIHIEGRHDHDAPRQVDSVLEPAGL